MISSLRFIRFIIVLGPLTCAALAQDDPERPVAKDAARTPAETAAAMKVPDGMRVDVIAAEPDLVQPIAYTFDERGRIWVLENTNYPDSPGTAKDRIVVLESTRGDGTFDKRTIFWDKATFTSGLAVGFGGVWLGSPPHLLFIPDKDGDAIPDGAPEVVLDGWGDRDTHETLNNFIWGPDGWLYGTQGVFTQSNVGKPGAPDAERVPINAGIWRYHPVKKRFERWCEGASNQWGLDWNDHGDAFFAACVIPHMWHAIEGGRYQRQAGSHFSPHIYEDLKTIAWGRYEKAAYCGAMIYLGGALPPEWHNRIFFHDIHMNKMRCEELVRFGSGYRSERRTELVFSPDAWFRGLSPQYGPDGAVYFNDWYDKVPCHQQAAFTDRGNGRIYRLGNEATKFAPVNLAKLSDAELVKMQLHENEWFVRQARRLLQERGAKPETTAALEQILFGNDNDTRQLRALWVLHSQGALSEKTALQVLKAESPYVRGWAITCVCEDGKPSPVILEMLNGMAAKDLHSSVRLRLASAAQKLSPAEAWPILETLSGHAEDANDHNLPLLIWYGLQNVIPQDPKRSAALLERIRIPKLHEFIARQLFFAVNSKETSTPTERGAVEMLIQFLAKSDSTARRSVLHGMLAAAEGHKKLKAPARWDVAYASLQKDPDGEVRNHSVKLALIFGSKEALRELKTILKDEKAATESRLTALESLAAQRDPALLPELLSLLKNPSALRPAAIRALSTFDDPAIATELINLYANLEAPEKVEALTTLAARRSSAQALFAAIESKQIPRSDLSATVVRTIQGFKDQSLDDWISKNWGSMKTSSAEKQAEIERLKKFLSTEAILAADLKNGAALFQRTCAICHTMFGEGGKIGPELPGRFEDLDYLLQNIVDPNAAIGNDYQQVFITKQNGELQTGVIISETPNAVTLKTFAAPVTIQRSEIKSLEVSPNSMMPEGLLNSMQEPEIRDLFLYLRQAQKP